MLSIIDPNLFFFITILLVKTYSYIYTLIHLYPYLYPFYTVHNQFIPTDTLSVTRQRNENFEI